MLMVSAMIVHIEPLKYYAADHMTILSIVYFDCIS